MPCLLLINSVLSQLWLHPLFYRVAKTALLRAMMYANQLADDNTNFVTKRLIERTFGRQKSLSRLCVTAPFTNQVDRAPSVR